MKEETKTLVGYRLERAKESLEEAKILFDGGYANTFVNRLYYACFYVVSALLLTKGFSSAKHSGIRSLFHQNLVKTGLVDMEFGLLYDKLFDNRQKSDYADLVRFDSGEVRHWYDEAKSFVGSLEILVKRELNAK